jgi:hypothetical protein
MQIHDVVSGMRLKIWNNSAAEKESEMNSKPLSQEAKFRKTVIHFLVLITGVVIFQDIILFFMFCDNVAKPINMNWSFEQSALFVVLVVFPCLLMILPSGYVREFMNPKPNLPSEPPEDTEPPKGTKTP